MQSRKLSPRTEALIAPIAPGLISERALFDIVYGKMRVLAGAGAPDLDDLVQQAAEQVLRSLPTFAGASQLSTWVSGVCYRVLLNQRRWYRRFSSRFVVGPSDAEHSAEPNPDGLLQGRDRILQLRRAVAKMSTKYRAVLVLHDFEELDIDEIAIIVGANAHTVRSRLRDGRKQLRKILCEDPDWEWEDSDVTGEDGR